MNEPSEPTLESRVAQLERLVAQLQEQIEAKPRAKPSNAGQRLGASPLPTAVPSESPVWVLRGEQWLGRVGLGLLFLGLAYLFRYSIDQGWITPAVRVATGTGIGAVLLVLGLRLQG